jgi:hypothetical protein
MAALRRDRRLAAHLGVVAEVLADSDSRASKGVSPGADMSNDFDIRPIHQGCALVGDEQDQAWFDRNPPRKVRSHPVQLSFRTSRTSFLPPPLGVLSGSDRERFEFAHEDVEAFVVL